MEQREHYFGLSFEECCELYDQKKETFRSEWERPLEEMLRHKIIDRIREVDGRSRQQMKKDGESCWQVIFPFYIPFEDSKGHREFYLFAQNGVDCGSAVVTLARIDDETEDLETLTLHELHQYRRLYSELNRMGFWKEEGLGIFHMD